MRGRVSIGAGLAITCAAAALAVNAQEPPSRDRPGTPVGSSVIRGRVLAADTERPLRLAGVTLAGEAVPPRYAATDDYGRYEFREVAAGRYILSVRKDAYLSVSYGQTRPSQGGKSLVVDGKQTVEDVNLALPRGGVITGTVVDEFGDPLPGVAVSALRTRFAEGRRSFVSTGPSETTDDLGGFRLSGLPPASYYISLRKLQTGLAAGMVVNSSLNFAPVYAPGTVDVADARRVTVALGQTMTGVDVVMVRVPMLSVSGTFLGRDGQPVTMAAVMLTRPGVFDPAPRVAEQGLNPGITRGFAFSNVPAGSYEVRAIHNGSLRALGDGEESHAAIGTVTVADQNVANVSLTPVAISRVQGRVVVDARAAAQFPAASVALATRSADPTAVAGWVAQSTPVPVKADLSFSLPALPGRWILSPTQSTVRGPWTESLPRGWILKAVRQGGLEVTDTGFEVREGVDVTDLEVEVTNRPQEVSGTVRDAKGAPSDDYTVLLFARDRTKWNGSSRYFAMIRPDQTAKFSASSLAPGEYFAIALDYIDENEAQDPELLERVSKNAIPFTLGEAERKVLELTIR